MLLVLPLRRCPAAFLVSSRLASCFRRFGEAEGQAAKSVSPLSSLHPEGLHLAPTFAVKKVQLARPGATLAPPQVEGPLTRPPCRSPSSPPTYSHSSSTRSSRTDARKTPRSPRAASSRRRSSRWRGPSSEDEGFTLEPATWVAKHLSSLALSPHLATLPRDLTPTSDLAVRGVVSNPEAPDSLLTIAPELCPNISSLDLHISGNSFNALSQTIIRLRPTLSKLVLHLYDTIPIHLDTANLLHALPHLQHLTLHLAAFAVEDVVPAVPLPLRTLVVENFEHRLEPHIFPFLTSASSATLISLDLPGCPRTPSAGAGAVGVHDFSYFLSLRALSLNLPGFEAPEVLLAAFCTQLDNIPSSVRPPERRARAIPLVGPRRGGHPRPHPELDRGRGCEGTVP